MTSITYPAGACQQRRCVVSCAPIFIPTRKERIAALDEAIKRGGGIVALPLAVIRPLGDIVNLAYALC